MVPSREDTLRVLACHPPSIGRKGGGLGFNRQAMNRACQTPRSRPETMHLMCRGLKRRVTREWRWLRHRDTSAIYYGSTYGPNYPSPVQVTVLQEYAHHKQLNDSLCLVVIRLCNGISTRQGFICLEPSKLQGQSYVMIHGATMGTPKVWQTRPSAREEKKNKPPTVM